MVALRFRWHNWYNFNLQHTQVNLAFHNEHDDIDTNPQNPQ